MMYLKQVVVFLLFYFNFCHCVTISKVWLNKCNKDGFTCFRKNDKVTAVVFECPVKTMNYQIFVNEFNGPATINSLTIKNCKNLTVRFKCTRIKSESKDLQRLYISRVENLKIQHNRYTDISQLPPEVVFEHIKLIEAIPGLSFSQNERLLMQAKKCILPKSDFHSISFRNVTIDTIHSNAFRMLKNFGNVTFVDSRIKNFFTYSVNVNHHKEGVFSMRQSTVEVLEPSALRVVGKSIIFSQNKFEKISSSGINAIVETFYFVNNSVNTLPPYALSIRSINTFILNNHFGWLKARALKKIGPNLMSNSKAVERSTFGYYFVENNINATEADCLHPDLAAYNKVSSNVTLARNILPCTCEKSDWLISTTDLDKVDPSQTSFYNMAFDKRLENICSSSCRLPISATKYMLKRNACVDNSTIEKMCRNLDKSTTTMKALLQAELTTTADGTPLTTNNKKLSTLPPVIFTPMEDAPIISPKNKSPSTLSPVQFTPITDVTTITINNKSSSMLPLPVQFSLIADVTTITTNKKNSTTLPPIQLTSAVGNMILTTKNKNTNKLAPESLATASSTSQYTPTSFRLTTKLQFLTLATIAGTKGVPKPTIIMAVTKLPRTTTKAPGFGNFIKPETSTMIKGSSYNHLCAAYRILLIFSLVPYIL